MRHGFGGAESEARFSFYLGSLASALGHSDREGPLKDYCACLLMPLKRKRVEPVERLRKTFFANMVMGKKCLGVTTMHSVRVRRAFVLAVLFAVLTFASPPAHAQSVRAPVGPWIVYIGRIRIVYSFTNEGLYYYKNTNDYAAGSVEEERGRYSVVNNIIVLLPNGGFPRKLRWQIGSELGKPILFLSDEYGYQQKFYYGE